MLRLAFLTKPRHDMKGPEQRKIPISLFQCYERNVLCGWSTWNKPTSAAVTKLPLIWGIFPFRPIQQPTTISAGETKPTIISVGETEPTTISAGETEPTTISTGETEPTTISTGETEPTTTHAGEKLTTISTGEKKTNDNISVREIKPMNGNLSLRRDTLQQTYQISISNNLSPIFSDSSRNLLRIQCVSNPVSTG